MNELTTFAAAWNSGLWLLLIQLAESIINENKSIAVN